MLPWTDFDIPLLQISTFLGEYSAALTRANAFDTKLDTDSRKTSADYAGVTALSVRQSLGANELTISKNSDGSWNTADVLLFMKGEPELFSVSSIADDALRNLERWCEYKEYSY